MAENGNVPKSEFLRMVEERGDIWLRFGVAHQNEENSLIFLDGVSGDELDHREEWTWAYSGLSLFARLVSGSSFRQFLEDEAITIGEQTVSLSGIGDTVNWTRHPSRADCGLERLPWPTIEYRMTNTQSLQLPTGLVIGRGAPSFQSYHAAIAAFLSIELPPGHQFNRSTVSIRSQDLVGRITSVVWTPTAIDVIIEGNGLGTSSIELASPIPGEVRSLSDDPLQEISFEIPASGLAPASWLVLRRDCEWLDYKFLNWPYALEPAPGVEIIANEQDEVLSLISQGEGPTIEFKENLPVKPGKERDGVCKEIAAFANGLGGTILLGVRNDGSIKGVADDLTTRDSIDAITNWIKDIVSPMPDFDVRIAEVVHVDEIGQISNLKIIVIPIEHGSSPPYCIKPGKPEYFVRRGATTLPAAPEQLRSIVQASLPAQNGSFYFDS